MSDDAHRWASFSSAFSIVLSLASDRIAELGCTPVGEDPKAFVDRGGLRRLETEAADAAIRRVREAAYPLIFKLFGSHLPQGKERKVILRRLGKDLSRIEVALEGGERHARAIVAGMRRHRRRAAGKRRRAASPPYPEPG
jgi:hypothetical protein